MGAELAFAHTMWCWQSLMKRTVRDRGCLRGDQRSVVPEQVWQSASNFESVVSLVPQTIPANRNTTGSKLLHEGPFIFDRHLHFETKAKSQPSAYAIPMRKGARLLTASSCSSIEHLRMLFFCPMMLRWRTKNTWRISICDVDAPNNRVVCIYAS